MNTTTRHHTIHVTFVVECDDFDDALDAVNKVIDGCVVETQELEPATDEDDDPDAEEEPGLPNIVEAFVTEPST